MKKILVVLIGSIALGLSGCLIGADPFTYKNDADPNARVESCVGGMAESSNGLCWRQATSEGVHYGEIDKSTICDTTDEGASWRLPTVQEYIRLLGSCSDSSEEYLLYCDSCEESSICSRVFPDYDDSGGSVGIYDYYLTSENYRVAMDTGQIIDDEDLDETDVVNIMCVHREAI